MKVTTFYYLLVRKKKDPKGLMCTLCQGHIEKRVHNN